MRGQNNQTRRPRLKHQFIYSKSLGRFDGTLFLPVTHSASSNQSKQINAIAVP